MTARTGLGQDNCDRTASTGESGQDSQDRTAGICQTRQIGLKSQPGQTVRTRRLEHDS
jgi:hypothetical protein